MSKTKEELNAIRAEYEDVKTKLAELTDDELEGVTGGSDSYFEPIISGETYEVDGGKDDWD